MPNHLISNKPLLLPLALLSVVIIVLLGLSLFFVAPNIQTELAQEVRDELTKYSIPAKITLSGRDVALSGTVNDLETKKKAALITEKVCGIRFVNNQLLTAKPKNIAMLASYHSTKEISASQESLKGPAQTPIIVSEEKQSADLNKTTIKPSKKTLDSELLSHKKAQKQNITANIDTNKQSLPIKITPEKQASHANKTEESTKEAATTTKHTNKVVTYDAMLAAMNAYNKKSKGRNPKQLQTMNLMFEDKTQAIAPESHAKLNKWTGHFKKNNKTIIHITVTSEETAQATQRAKNIKTYLIDQGIEENRIKTKTQQGKTAVSFILK